MRLQRVSVAAPFVDATVDPDELVDVFHTWVRDRTLGGLPIDVARYGHVPNGPGVMVIGFSGDYSVEMSSGVPSLRYTLKRENEGSVAELVTLAAGRLQQAATQLEADAGHAIDLQNVTVRVADKLVAPNTVEGRALVESDAVAAVCATFGLGDASVRSVTDDPRDPITLTVTCVPASAS